VNSRDRFKYKKYFSRQKQEKYFEYDDKYILIPADSIHTSFLLNEKASNESWSAKLGAWSQIGMLLLVGFGYFYTVRPAFQYQLLQEQAAKLEIEKLESKKQLGNLEIAKTQIENDLDVLKETLSRKDAERHKLQTQLTQEHVKVDLAKKQIQEIKNKVSKELKALESTRWELLLLDFSDAYFLSERNELFSRLNRSEEFDEYLLNEQKSWPQSYENLSKSIDRISEKNKKTNKFPKEYLIELHKIVDAQKSTLECNVVNFKLIAAQYYKETDGLTVNEDEINDKLEKYIAELVAESEKEGYKSIITDDFRKSVRKGFHREKEQTIKLKLYEIESKYRHEISKLREKCYKKGTDLIDQIKKEKGGQVKLNDIFD
jgi:hypothetical protein